MGSATCFNDIGVITKCSFDQFEEFVHKYLDGFCGRAPAVYASYADIWTLEEWWTVTDFVQTICTDYFAKGWSDDELKNQLSDLPANYQQFFVTTFTVRRNDLRMALVDKINTISHTSLVDFDWKAKVALASDRLASIWQPLLSLDLDLESGGKKRSFQLEMDREELKKLITSLDAANKALSQLT